MAASRSMTTGNPVLSAKCRPRTSTAFLAAPVWPADSSGRGIVSRHGPSPDHQMLRAETRRGRSGADGGPSPAMCPSSYLTWQLPIGGSWSGGIVLRTCSDWPLILATYVV
jgi:hypothetical protein